MTTEIISEHNEHTSKRLRRPTSPRGWAMAVGAILAPLGLALGLWLGVSWGSTATPASVLAGDGYPVTMTLSHQQIIALGGGDGQMVAGFIDSGAFGAGSARGEMVLALTPQGRALFASQAMINDMAHGVGQGVTGHMSGDFLVLDGPVGSLGS